MKIGLLLPEDWEAPATHYAIPQKKGGGTVFWGCPAFGDGCPCAAVPVHKRQPAWAILADALWDAANALNPAPAAGSRCTADRGAAPL